MLTAGRINFKVLLIFISLLFLPLYLSFPSVVFADNIFTFSTDPQSIPIGEMSGAITIHSEVPVTETTYITLVSSSSAGQFFSNKTSTESIASGSYVYISSGTSNRTVYYKDTTAGDFIITANIFNKEKTSQIATINQHIIVGSQTSGGSSTTTDSTATTTTTQTTSTNTTNTSTTLSAHYGSAGLSIVEPISKFEVGAGRARLGMVGTPIEFRPEMKYSYNGNMTFKWSFGDGAIGYGQVLSHSYAYPGEYVVILNVSSAGGQAVSRVNVKVVSADISISLASSERVEVSNNSKNEVNLFGRALSSQGKLFVFPEDTIIKAGQKISFASSITGLQPLNENNVSMIVVGDSLNKAFIPVVQIAENKPDDKKLQIEVLYSKAQEIQKQLATLPKESNLAVRQPSDSNVATAFLSLNSNSTSSATTTQISRRGWFQTVKEFFLGRKQ